MTVHGLKTLLSLLAIAVLLTGCPDSGKSIMVVGDADVGDDVTSDIGDVFVPEDEVSPPEDICPNQDCVEAEVDIQEDEISPPPDEISPPEPEISFCVTTASGCESEFADCLTLADDQYPGIAGLQVNVNVTSANIAQGTKVELWIDGILVDSTNKPADEFSFNQVTLTHKADGHTLEVRVPGIVNSQLSVCAETGDCGITVEPSNEDCAAGDADRHGH